MPRPKAIDFLLLPGFPAVCLTAMIEPLRAANEILGQRAYCWRILSEGGAAVPCSAEIMFAPDARLADCQIFDLDAFFVLSNVCEGFSEPRVATATLRKLERSGVEVGAVSAAVFRLAEAGLLHGRRSSVHWLYKTAFEIRHPGVEICEDLIVRDGRVTTVSGASAALELMIQDLADAHGTALATEVACWFQHPTIRGVGVPQSVPVPGSSRTTMRTGPLVASAISNLDNSFDGDVSVDDLAAELGVSTRTLQRRFLREVGQSPMQYVHHLRLTAARDLFRYSDLGATDIALQVGYASASRMKARYIDAFGYAPAEERRRWNERRLSRAAVGRKLEEVPT